MDGYIKHSATWASVKWPQRRPCKGFKISNFMAAYGRGRLLLTRDTTYRTGGWAAQCVWSLVCAVTRRTRFMLHHWNEQTWPLAYHRQLQSEIIGRGCSAVKLGHWCQCRRQCTHEQVPSEDRQRRHAGNCDVKGRCWRQATQDKRLQRQLPLSIPECPVGRRSPGSGNHMLRVVHSV